MVAIFSDIIQLINKNTYRLRDEKSRFSSNMAITATSGFPYYDSFNNIQYESKPYLSFDIGGSYLPDVEDEIRLFL